MDLEDSFTEKIIQRSKLRKEFLNEKKMEILSAGKKRAVLIDECQVNSGEPPNKSPKWQSSQTLQTANSHDKENLEIQDEDSSIPFVPVHSDSKTKGLAALRKNFLNGEDDPVCDSSLQAESQVNKSNTYVYSTNSSELCSGQRSRLANLAADIRQWEDDAPRSTLSSNSVATHKLFTSSANSPNSASQTNAFSMKLYYTPTKSNSGESSNSNPFPVSGHSEGGVNSLSVHKQCNIGVVSVGSRCEKLQAWDEAIKATLENKDEQGTCKIEQTKHQELSKKPKAAMEDSIKADVDPAELPLSARKALFEKAFLGETLKADENVIDHKLTVAQRAAFFESASKVTAVPQSINYKEPKHSTLSNLSKFGKNNFTSPTSSNLSKFGKTSIASPVNIVQPDENMKPEVIKVSPVKKISSLVNQWEKLSSSSVENSSEVESNNLLSEECSSYNSDFIQEASEHDDEVEDNADEDEDNVNNEADDDASDDNEYDVNDEAGCDINDEQDDYCPNEDADMPENVFYPSQTEEVSLKSVEDEGSTCEREGSQTPSENTGSLMSSVSYSGISSYSDESSYNASSSQSCTSCSSVRSYDATSCNVNQKVSDNKKEKNSEVPLLYTVSFYRKQKQETRLTPVRTIVRREKVSSPESSDIDYTERIQERLKGLQEEILRQQTIISQTSQALNLCSATAEFSGSLEQVEGERLLLIATQKRQACLNEVTRLKTFGAQGENISDGKGTLTITDLQLPLKREFIASQLEGKGSDTVHYFLCLIRHGAQVIVTQMMSTDDKLADGALCFTNHIQLRNLPADFSVIFEVYALQTKKEVLPHEKKYHIKREHSKIRLTPKGKKSDGKILLPAVSSPGGPSAVRSPSFGVVGFTRFSLQNCNKKTFTLDKVPFASPLEGVLRVQLQLHAEHRVVEKGFLTMFEDVSGFGAWHRRWCALNASHLAFWKYPDDEHKKEPTGIIDLKQCVTSQVKLVARDVCARPHTFQLVTVRPQEKGDKNTLISRSVNTLTTTKHLLSADTKEERILWCNKLNEALTNVRKWDPQALRPIEAMKN